MDFKKIKKVAIYPAIGIARVGNSPDEFFLGSMIPGVPAQDPDNFRDKTKRIKRQGAKFFVYGLDAQGNILGELNESHGVKVDWRVDVANKKAAWYNFDIALDIPAAEGAYDSEGIPQTDGLPVLSQRRNQDFKGDERKLLMIEPRAIHISGKNKNEDGKQFQFEGTIGRYEQQVNLGELRTDEEGRLIFLGGYGKSDSFTKPAAPLTTFANNQGWHDDTSDGPVDATVKLPDGRTLEAEGAWVVTAPTNFAVGVQAFSTGYELLLDVAAKNHPELKKAKPSFFKDIYPTLQQLSINQWVNAGVSLEFGWGSAYEFDSEALIKRLNDTSDKSRPLRQTIFELFRDPAYDVMQPQAWPPLYGDAVTFNINSSDPRAWYAITELKYAYLQQWAKGDFIVDEYVPPLKWEEMTPEQQANGLTEAALEETLGGPFHPGCEFTWPMRHAMMYDKKSPFRIKRRKRAKDDYGVALSPEIALAPRGPLDGSAPGDITRWMATPWQSDTSSCLSAYRAYAGEYLPTFWPARVPNDVLTEKDFKTIQKSRSMDQKIKAFSASSRKKWLRGFIFDDEGNFLGGTSIEARLAGVTKFTEEWYKIGIILKEKSNANPDLFPEDIWVETGRHLEAKKPGKTTKLMASKNTAKKPVVSKHPDWVMMNPRYLR